MNRTAAVPMLLGCLLLATACSKPEPEAAPEPAAEAAAPAVAADAPTRPDPMAGRGPGEEGLMPMTLPEPVIDSTPVDTVVSRIDSSNQASDTELTAPISDQFTAKDSIFLDIRTNGTAEKYTISSKWLYPDGSVITENSQVINGAGPVSTIFSMSKPDGWAPGTYQVEISINGKLQQTKKFEVR